MTRFLSGKTFSRRHSSFGSKEISCVHWSENLVLYKTARNTEERLWAFQDQKSSWGVLIEKDHSLPFVQVEKERGKVG